MSTTHTTAGPGATAKALTRRRPSGLALLEVGVAVLAVSLPAVLLAPVLRRTRDAAQIEHCLGNLRQIGTAMNMYFQETSDWFPWEKNNTLQYLTAFYYGGHPGRSFEPNAPGHWWGYVDPNFRDTPGGRPFNQYIYPLLPKVDIPPTDPRFEKVRDVPVFRCPADRGGVYGDMSLYGEVGTSYDCNYNFPTQWALNRIPDPNSHRRWMNYSNAFVRVQLRQNASSMIMLYEDPFDFALWQSIRSRGWHGEWNRHSFLFLDGHAGYTLADTTAGRKTSGVGWKACAKPSFGAPGWWQDVNDPDYRYRTIAPVP